MGRAITPEQAKLKTNIPDFVIEAVNALLRQEYSEGSATIKQDDLIKEIIRTWPEDLPVSPSKSSKRDMIFNKKWLEIEEEFNKAGWKVEYDKPGYNEDYDAHWNFSKKGSRN